MVVFLGPQMKEKLTELLRFADQFSHGPGQDACIVNEDQLLAMIRLSKDVSANLDKIESLREQSMPELFAGAYIPMKPMTFIARKRRHERLVCELDSYIHEKEEKKTVGLTMTIDTIRLAKTLTSVVVAESQRHRSGVLGRMVQEVFAMFVGSCIASDSNGMRSRRQRLRDRKPSESLKAFFEALF